MLTRSHKLFIPFLLFTISTPIAIAEDSYKDTLLKYGGGGLLVGITCALLLKKLNQKESPESPKAQNISLPTIRAYMQSHHPVVHLIRCIVSKNKNVIKSIQLHVLHPYNAILDGLAIEKDLEKGLELSSSANITVLQEVNEDTHASYELNALRNYITSNYPEYICVDITKNYTGIELTLKYGDEPIDCEALEQELRTALSFPSNLLLKVTTI